MSSLKLVRRIRLTLDLYLTRIRRNLLLLAITLLLVLVSNILTS